jgi:putative endonuclease
MNESKWWVYIIECCNNSLYTGITTDVERRFDEHQNNNKKASKYCAKLRPLKLVYKSLPFENKSEASKEEYRIKQLCHKEKKDFIKTNT